MKTRVVTLVCLFLTVIAPIPGRNAPSQKSKPNLTGSWALELFVDSKGKSVKPDKEVVWVVTHQEPEIKFIEDEEGEKPLELSYYTDGRGEENPSEISINIVGRSRDPAQENEKLASKTSWDGDKLVSRAKLERTVNGHIIRMELVKEWKASKDGRSLTITSRTTNLNPSANVTSSGMAFRSMTSETKMIFRRTLIELIK